MKALTNKEISERLKENYGDLSAFCRFMDLSINGLKKKLESTKPKDNLSGMYTEFLIEQKKGK